MKVNMSANLQQIINATTGWSIETTPAVANKISSFYDILAPKTSVNVTFLPGSDPMETVQIAERLYKDGMNPIPHLAARSLFNRSQLDELLGAFVDRAFVDEVLIIAGGVSKPIGDFSNSMAVLKTGLLQKHGIKKVGVAGHPEGSPDINDLDLSKALLEKNDFAINEGLNMYIETQFCFDADTVLNWEKQIRRSGNKLPIRIGIPGPATIKTLFRFAKLVGIGNSMKFLAKQSRNVSKLLTIQSPDKLLSGLSTGIANDPDCLIKHFHFYPFGGFSETAAYAESIVSGNISMLSEGRFVPKERLAG
jgi:methylenetetrahydrofolate reductase (NADPH)